jgi:hypothetical protein
MSRIVAIIKKPIFIFTIILPIALIAELVTLEGISGISLPRIVGLQSPAMRSE